MDCHLVAVRWGFCPRLQSTRDCLSCPTTHNGFSLQPKGRGFVILLPSPAKPEMALEEDGELSEDAWPEHLSALLLEGWTSQSAS